MESWTLGERPELWLVGVWIVAQLLWSQRERLAALFSRKAEVSLRRDESALDFNGQVKDKVLRDSERNWELVGWLKAQAERADIERRAAAGEVLERSRSSDALATQSVAVMQDFVEVARQLVNRQDERDQELLALVGEANRTLHAVGFVLARLYFREGQERGYSDLLKEMDNGGQ